MTTIHVTQECIDEGQRVPIGKERCEKCAVAIAFVNAGFRNVQVFVGSFLVDGYPEMDLPPAANKFVDRADRFMRLSPISFEVDADPPAKA